MLWIAELKSKFYTRKFDLSNWKSKLKDVHQTAWVKWDLARDMCPLPPDAEEQTPGEVDESIFQDLASVMNALPAPKKYDRAS